MSDRVAGWGARLLQGRAFVRAPLPSFRVGLGFLLTRRMLMLEHVGRTSPWFRDVVAEPSCHVSIGFTRRRPAVARVLDAGESEAALADCRQAHPGSWEKLSAIITEATGEADPDVPLVRLQLHPVRRPR